MKMINFYYCVIYDLGNMYKCRYMSYIHTHTHTHWYIYRHIHRTLTYAHAQLQVHWTQWGLVMLVIYFPQLIAMSRKKGLSLLFTRPVLNKSYMLLQLGLTKVLENNYYSPLKEKETVKTGVLLKSQTCRRCI